MGGSSISGARTARPMYSDFAIVKGEEADTIGLEVVDLRIVYG